MIKDIFRSLVAVMFLFLALVVVAYSSNQKELLKKEHKKVNPLTNYYEGNLLNKNYNLPIVVIDTNKNTIKKGEETTGKIQIYDNKNGLNNLKMEPQTVSYASFKVRGNSTSKYPKKQFSIKLLNKKGKEKEESILGMPKDASWVLNAPFADKSLMRNYITLNASSHIMGYAPKVRFCEVFVLDDGSNNIKKEDYQGVYMMIEKINRGEDRVDITKTLENRDETSFILAKDRQKPGDIPIDTYGKETYIYNNGINIEYPKKDLTPKKYEYIQNYINEFERMLYSDKFNDPLVGYEKYIDTNSFVDFYIINEFFKNTDAGIYSTYFYKDYNDKMKAGPVWDFNQSLGNHTEDIGDPFEYEGFFMNQRPWFDKLMEDKKFADKVVRRYKELRKTYLSDKYLIEEIDKATNILGDSVDRNFSKWPISLANQASVFEENESISREYSSDSSKYKDFLEKNKHLIKSTHGKAKSYDKEIDLMKKFIINRGKWMDQNIDSLSKWAS
ncbi:CotH kinase family protein [Paraclostridium tenue]|uniref:CotH kinase family protein n=1 Tax=Paeniclostridium hominis TaxID=2764329 RepID=A0ABR7K111_9FIRM|nr:MULTISPECIES: CotH kinase family protein [Paeniclostridium]MBC6002691.1 CotH kinase family protein [Paeniclostridium hominis]